MPHSSFSPAESRALNQTIVNSLSSDVPAIRKEAQDGLGDYLRIRAREDGFLRSILPPIAISHDDLDRQRDTFKPVRVEDMEPSSPAAISVPFGTSPVDHFVRGPRYSIMFDRIMSRRFATDKNDLLTYNMNINQILENLLLKDIMAEEDRKWILVSNTTVGTLNAINAELGARQFISVGALDRVTLAHARKGLPSTNRHLNPSVALINNILIWDVAALDRTEIGGDLAEELFINGFAERTIFGTKWLITIKTDLVADDEMYQYAAPEYLGRFYTLDDITVSTKFEDYWIEFFAYESIGASLANTAAVAKVTFSGSFTDWKS